MRAYSFIVVSALAGMLVFAASGEQPSTEPSESQMERPFGEFFSKVEAKQLSEKQTTEVAELETEVARLEARKRSLQSEFESYQAKYQIK